LLAKAKEVTPTVAAEDGIKYVISDGSEIMSDPTLHREAQSVAMKPRDPGDWNEASTAV
jgi:hypothetical protein